MLLRHLMKSPAAATAGSALCRLESSAAGNGKKAKSTMTNTNSTIFRNEKFGQEKARQMALFSRVEKIQVNHVGPPEDCSLLMNKGLSTPFNCAMHIQELLMNRSVLALVNGEPWDMHRPLVEDCQLQFAHFKDEDPSLSNEAFWRTGSFLLGYIAERAFKDEYLVQLCSFPRPNVSSGSFVYDIDIPVSNWSPSKAELNCLSRLASTLQYTDSVFERLEVDASIALDMFQHNRYKSEQIPQIAAQSSTGSHITIYRLKDHVDISRGPLVSSTQLISRFNVTAVHNIESPDLGSLKRLQGIALPKQLPIHFWAYDILCQRASLLNDRAPLPCRSTPIQKQLAGQE